MSIERNFDCFALVAFAGFHYLFDNIFKRVPIVVIQNDAKGAAPAIAVIEVGDDVEFGNRQNIGFGVLHGGVEADVGNGGNKMRHKQKGRAQSGARRNGLERDPLNGFGFTIRI